METHRLKAEKRTVLGRKIKKLRRSGILPANLFGKKIKSIALQVNLKEFEKVYKGAGKTGVVELEVSGKTQPVLIKNLQIHPVLQQILHVDFYRVDLTEKIKATIPLEIVGEAPAVSDKKGVLLTILSELEVEALPNDLPEKIEVDISKLSEIDQVIAVTDLSVSSKLTVLTSSDREVAKIGPLVTKEAEKQAEEDEAAAEAASETEAEKAEEGEEKADEKSTGEKDEKSTGKQTEEKSSSEEKAPENKAEPSESKQKESEQQKK